MIAAQWFGKIKKHGLKIFLISSILLIFISSFYFFQSIKFKTQILSLTETFNDTKKELNDLKNEDQLKINNQLKIDIKSTNDVFGKTLKAYEGIVDLKSQKQDTKDLDKSYAQIIKKE